MESFIATRPSKPSGDPEMVNFPLQIDRQVSVVLNTDRSHNYRPRRRFNMFQAQQHSKQKVITSKEYDA